MRCQIPPLNGGGSGGGGIGVVASFFFSHLNAKRNAKERTVRLKRGWQGSVGGGGGGGVE